MYPIQCAGGFFTGIKRGKFKVDAVSAIVNDSTAIARLGLIDDKSLPYEQGQGMVYDADYDKQSCIIDLQSSAAIDGTVTFVPNDCISILYGTSIVHSNNIKAGTIKVYVR